MVMVCVSYDKRRSQYATTAHALQNEPGSHRIADRVGAGQLAGDEKLGERIGQGLDRDLVGQRRRGTETRYIKRDHLTLGCEVVEDRTPLVPTTAQTVV